MPILLSEFSGSSDIASPASSCTVIYATSSPIVLVRLFISPEVSLSGELSRKRRWESVDLSSGVSKGEMWGEFQYF